MVLLSSRLNSASILYTIGRQLDGRLVAIESDTEERFRPLIKIDRPKKGCRMV